MAQVTIESEQLQSILSKSAEFVNAASPRLERLAALEAGLTDLATKAAQSLVDGNLISAADASKVREEIAGGGLGKVAEVIEFASRHATVPSLGKVAVDEGKVAERSADDAWNEGFGLGR